MPTLHLSNEDICALLQGTQDILTPLAKAEETAFASASCPQCGSTECQPFMDPKRLFIPGNPLPYRLMRCMSCQTEFNPRNNLVVKSRG